jgi:hypothetical protein
MAGLGYKLFAAGEVLTAANLQGYAVDQSAMVFATSAARTVALVAPSQGMVSFLNDSGTLWQYYELYNVSTNPGGAAAAGWYPISGAAMFYGTASRSAASGTTYSIGAASYLYTEIIDPLNWHSAVTNTERITPTVAGVYRVTLQGQPTGNVTGNRQLNCAKNGTPFVRNTLPGASNTELSVSGIAVMNGSSDYFVFSALQDSGSSLTFATQACVEFLRPSSV